MGLTAPVRSYKVKFEAVQESECIFVCVYACMHACWAEGGNVKNIVFLNALWSDRPLGPSGALQLECKT